MDDLSLEIGKRIRQKRIEKHWKEKDLQKSLGKPTGKMVSNWEKGKSTPSPFYLIKLAKVLDTSTDFLLTGQENDKFDKIIVTYEDAIECVMALLKSELFVSSVSQEDDMVINISLNSDDCILCLFFSDLRKLKKAEYILGESLYEQQVEKLKNSYNQKINELSGDLPF